MQLFTRIYAKGIHWLRSCLAACAETVNHGISDLSRQKQKLTALIIVSSNAWRVGWVEERNPTNTKCWVSLRSTQPTRWSK
jgi:hypothetical protein